MNLNGSTIIIKKRAADPEVKSDLSALMKKSRRALSERDRLMEKSASLVEEVKLAKKKVLQDFDGFLFGAAKRLGERGLPVFIAKKPIDVGEYIREIVGQDRIGVVPSPQTMESEIMQAFYMTNKIEIWSKKYGGHDAGMPYVHPYFPYPRSGKEPLAAGESEDAGQGMLTQWTGGRNAGGQGAAGAHEGVRAQSDAASQSPANAAPSQPPERKAKYVVLSALVATDTGLVYLEEDEIEAMGTANTAFIIVTADRIFPEADADDVEHLMEVASGKAIKAGKVPAKGHIIILDNNRISLARSELKDLLYCINCYACSLYCPVYLTIGSLFGSPAMAGIGALSVSYQSGMKAGIKRGLDFCTLCGRCEVECPTGVPLVGLTRKNRKKARFSGL